MLQKGPALRQVFLVRTAEWTRTLLGVGSGYADVDFREPDKAKFAFWAFSEVQVRIGERSSVRRVMSSSCSQPSPTKE
jgi:hypothetical protein